MADVEFGTSDVSAMLAEMENEDNAGKFVSQYWSPKSEGTTKIRFLPQLNSFGEKNFYRKHKVHYINGRPYMCLEQTLTDKNGNPHESEKCPFCTKSKQLYSCSTKGTEEWALAGDLRAKDRFVARVVVRGNKDKDNNDIEYKPEFYEFGTKIRDMIKAALMSGEYGNPFDLKAGRDFNLTKHGQRKSTDYSGSMFAVNQTPIFTDTTKLKALLAELPKMDYNQLVEFASAKELSKVLKDYLNGGSDEDVETKTSAPTPDVGMSDDDIFGVAKAVTESKADSSSEPEDDLDALLAGI